MPNQAPITQLITDGKPLLSVEFFPPKTEEAVTDLQAAALEINALEPDFVSVTYGAGGTTRSRSAKVSQVMKDEVSLNVMPHLTCVGATREELGEIVDEFYNEGYRNIMTLRGDPPKGHEAFVATEGGFSYASDLVSFIKNRYPDFCLGVAGYPEKHPEAASLDKDLDHLKIKIEAGASFITTQLFFDNAAFYDFVEKARSRDIEVPIFPRHHARRILQADTTNPKDVRLSTPQSLGGETSPRPRRRRSRKKNRRRMGQRATRGSPRPKKSPASTSTPSTKPISLST